MADRKLKRISDFEWASVTQYLVYIASAAKLEEINSDHVNSFPLARLGAGLMALRKKRVLVKLRGNKEKLERFAGEFKGELGESEISVLRSLYVQYKRDIDTVEKHIRVVELYKEEFVNSMFDLDWEGNNELPF